jgi:hypothetical protein
MHTDSYRFWGLPSLKARGAIGTALPGLFVSSVFVLTGISSILICAQTSAAGTVSNPTSAFIARSALNFDMPAVGNFTSATPA